jgi:hypothetical protein
MYGDDAFDASLEIGALLDILDSNMPPLWRLVQKL